MAFIENVRVGKAYRVLVGVDQATGRNIYDKVSTWTDSRDVELPNGHALSEVQGEFMYASAVLPANATTVTVEGSNITADGMLDFYVPTEFYGVSPISVSNQVNGSVTLEFAPQSEPMEVRVICKNLSQAT